MSTADPLGPLRSLLGTWTGEGDGAYPTIRPFRYRETVVFDDRGRPFVHYEQRTANPDDGAPMHTETGYLRPAGGGAVELLLVQPTGIVEIHEGSFDGTVLELVPTLTATSTSAKPVTTVRRRITVRDDELSYDVWMAVGDIPETHHLHAVLHRADRHEGP